MTYDKAILSDCMETIQHYHRMLQLRLFKDGVNVKTLTGHVWQFDISEDFIRVYDDAPTGQDMPRHKGELIFSVPMKDVGAFERVRPTATELDLYHNLLDLRSDYLNNKVNKEQYAAEKRKLLAQFSENGIAIDEEKFSLSHEWV
jgi:hypothetical protein